MNPDNKNSLETFVERHRADFDTHEPRPDLWAALEQHLAPPAAPQMRLADAVPAPSAPPSAIVVPVAPVRAGWLQRYGAAATLALLVFAAGASEAWRNKHPAPVPVAAAGPIGAGRTAEATGADEALYQGNNPLAMSAAERTTGADSQLVRAVRGMEAYYTNQLARRQNELRQLSGPALIGMTEDWQRELVSLDSSYRQLKLELPRNPQPDDVLTAMNRNLQIRLDILDQQLHLNPAGEASPGPGAYVLADSRRLHQ